MFKNNKPPSGSETYGSDSTCLSSALESHDAAPIQIR